MDKSWVKLRRMSSEYKECINAFLDHAFVTSSIDNKIAYPHALCGNRFYHERETLRGHLLLKAMDGDYQKDIWVFHGEHSFTDYDSDRDVVDDEFIYENHESFEHDMHAMIYEAFEHHVSYNSSSGPTEESTAFLKLIKDVGQPLYLGCDEFSKLSFVVEMYNLECLYGMSDKEFDAIVKLFKRALPRDSTLPNSFKKMQIIIKQFHLGYEEIDVHANDCVFF